MPKERSKKTGTRATKKKTKATAKRVRKRSPALASKKPDARPTSQVLRVRQVRSGIGHAGTYRRTLLALGLKHHQDVVRVTDNPSTRGMLRKVRHLVEVTPVEA